MDAPKCIYVYVEIYGSPWLEPKAPQMAQNYIYPFTRNRFAAVM
jgi:hypothetical protein